MMLSGVPQLTLESDGISYVPGAVSPATAASVARFLMNQELNEVKLNSHEIFNLLKGHLADGQWRLSRNYEATSDRFREAGGLTTRGGSP